MADTKYVFKYVEGAEALKEVFVDQLAEEIAESQLDDALLLRAAVQMIKMATKSLSELQAMLDTIEEDTDQKAVDRAYQIGNEYWS